MSQPPKIPQPNSPKNGAIDKRLAAAIERNDVEAVRRFVEKGRGGGQDHWGETPLMLAVRHAGIECARLLAGACDPSAVAHANGLTAPNARNWRGETALALAIWAGRLQPAALLAAKTDLSRTADGKIPVELAFERRSTNAEIFDFIASLDPTPLAIDLAKQAWAEGRETPRLLARLERDALGAEVVMAAEGDRSANPALERATPRL
jgi:hypothetical protein